MSGRLVIVSLLLLYLYDVCRGQSIGTQVEICYHQEEAEVLNCRKNEVIAISEIGEKQSRTECYGDKCCLLLFDTKMHNIRNDKKNHIKLLQTVLSECSQKKNCVIMDEFLSDSKGHNFTVGNGLKALSLLMIYKCVEADAHVLMCEDNSAIIKGGEHMFISMPTEQHFSSGDLRCQCDVRSTENVPLTLMDVRLGDNPNDRLIFRDRKGELAHIFTGGKESIFLDESVSLDKLTTLNLLLSKTFKPGNIWMKVQGNLNSGVTVTCQVPDHDSLTMESHQAMNNVEDDISDEDNGSGLLRFVYYFTAGLGASLVLLLTAYVIIRMVKRKSRHDRTTRTRREVEGSEKPMYHHPKSAPTNRESFTHQDMYFRDWRTSQCADRTSTSSDKCPPPLPKPRCQSKRDINVYSKDSETSALNKDVPEEATA